MMAIPIALPVARYGKPLACHRGRYSQSPRSNARAPIGETGNNPSGLPVCSLHPRNPEFRIASGLPSISLTSVSVIPSRTFLQRALSDSGAVTRADANAAQTSASKTNLLMSGASYVLCERPAQDWASIANANEEVGVKFFSTGDKMRETHAVCVSLTHGKRKSSNATRAAAAWTPAVQCSHIARRLRRMLAGPERGTSRPAAR